MLLLTVTSVASASQRATDHEVKAVFLYHFAKYVEWPPRDGATTEDEVTIGVVGGDDFAAILRRTIADDAVSDRHLSVKAVESAATVGDCQIVFVSSSYEESSEILRRAEGKNILTVGEVEGFASSGGIIGFRIDNNRVRFEINLDAAKKAQLNISSQLLKLADIVHSETK